MKITPLTCVLSDRKTSNGAKIYNLSFKTAGMPDGMSMSAVTFSDTIVAEVEKCKNQEVDAEFSIRQYNGQDSYTLNKINGVEKSGFGKRGQGYQKDVISEERKESARLAIKLVELAPPDKATPANLKKAFKDYAEEVYAWISARPSVPAAAGGLPEQKIEDTPPHSDEDAPA